MDLYVHEREEVSYVAISGRFDQTAVEEADQTFSDATAGRGLPTIIDMSGVTFMSSIGIGFLYANTKALKKAGSKLVLLNPKGMVETVLKSSKMHRVMPIAYGLEEALNILGFEKAAVGDDIPQTDDSAQPTAAKANPNAEAELQITITNQTSELTDLYSKVENFLDAHASPPRTRYIVNLALEELVVNVIRYAFEDFDEHTIDISVSFADEQFTLVIVDGGRAFDPHDALSDELNPDLEEEGDEDLDFEVGGLGLQLVNDLVDTLSYSRVSEKNRVEVRVKFQEGEVPSEQGVG